MPSLKSLLKEYLSKEELITMINSYQYKEEIVDMISSYDKDSKNEVYTGQQKSALLHQFLENIFCIHLVPLFTGEQFSALNCPPLIGKGTQGIVFNFYLKTIESKINDLLQFKNITLERIRKGKIIPNTDDYVALKIQLINNPNEKYWESRMLREEFILNKLQDFESIKKHVPQFYFGCTIIMPIDSINHKIRLTIMELINTQDYIPFNHFFINEISTNQQYNYIFDNIYNSIEKLVHTLWKHGISHNDLSVNNILINKSVYRTNNYDESIKLIDFGLSTLFAPLKESSNITDDYIEYFNKLSTKEQQGSNVQKLKELLLLKRT